MKLVKRPRDAVCAVYLVFGFVSACGGDVAVGRQVPAEPASDVLLGSWWLSELTESGQTVPRHPEHSYI